MPCACFQEPLGEGAELFGGRLPVGREPTQEPLVPGHACPRRSVGPPLWRG